MDVVVGDGDGAVDGSVDVVEMGMAVMVLLMVVVM